MITAVYVDRFHQRAMDVSADTLATHTGVSARQRDGWTGGAATGPSQSPPRAEAGALADGLASGDGSGVLPCDLHVGEAVVEVASAGGDGAVVLVVDRSDALFVVAVSDKAVLSVEPGVRIGFLTPVLLKGKVERMCTMEQVGECPRELIASLCRQFYTQGWVSGTGGGISIWHGPHIYVAPSGVQKERIQPADLFVLDPKGNVIETPQNANFRPSACTPLFMAAFELRDARAVIHTHSINTMLATLISGKEFRVTHLEMIKGLSGHGYHDTLVIPVIDNTAYEHELADSLRQAIIDYPKAPAVLVRRHGCYVWGKTWIQAKTQAECLDYLFEAAVRMRQIGFDASQPPAEDEGKQAKAGNGVADVAAEPAAKKARAG